MENMSSQYVNSMNCFVSYDVGQFGGGWLYGWPMTHSMFGLNLGLHWHLWVPQVHGISMLVQCCLEVIHCRFMRS